MTTRFDFLAAYVKQYPGVNPLGVYCQTTGKLIATLTDSEASGLFALVESMDSESAADDWFVRQMASMRPSMQWNVMRTDSLNVLRKVDPLGCLGYMMTRLMHTKVRKPLMNGALVDLPTQQEVIDANRHKVLLMAAMSQWNPLLVKRVLYMLTLADARIGLHELTPPFHVSELYNGQTNAFNMRTKLMTWYADVLTMIVEREKNRSQSSEFYRDGNTLAKHAHVSMFFESGHRTDLIARLNESKEEKRVRLAKQRVTGVNREKRDARQADKDFMRNVLTQLMHETPTATTAPPTQSTPTPAPRKITGFGLKRKETN